MFLHAANRRDRCAFGEFCSFSFFFLFSLFSFTTEFVTPARMLRYYCYSHSRWTLVPVSACALPTGGYYFYTLIKEKERVNRLRRCSSLPIRWLLKRCQCIILYFSLDVYRHYRIINYCFTNSHRHICT